MKGSPRERDRVPHGPDKPLWARLIRAARLDHDWSQDKLAEEADVPLHQVGRADAGRNKPSQKYAPKFRRALRIPPDVMDAALVNDDERSPAEEELVLDYISRLGAPASTEVDLPLDVTVPTPRRAPHRRAEGSDGP